MRLMFYSLTRTRSLRAFRPKSDYALQGRGIYQSIGSDLHSTEVVQVVGVRINNTSENE